MSGTDGDSRAGTDFGRYLADAEGPNLEDLHKWWNDFG